MNKVPSVIEGIRTIEDAHRVYEVCGAHTDAVPLHTMRERVVAAFNEASRKYDTPRRLRSKPCNGVVETDRELKKRLNWLRNRVAEVTA